MKINFIASGSSGNAIIVDDGHSKLLLDAGLSYRKLSRHVALSDVSGILISHEHGDHSKAMPELIRRGYPVYASGGTWDAMGLHPDYYTGHLLHDGRQLQIGSWVVVPFDVVHDAAEPMGFLFQSINTGKKGVYVVDSSYVNYNFKEVSHWLIEANYDEDILARSEYKEWLKNRIRKNHFSFDNLLRFLGSSDMSTAEEIWLLHLSDANSNEKKFVQEVQALTGVPVYCN